MMRRSLALLWLLTGCGGPQSALTPSGAEAEEISRLFWTATIVSLTVLTLVSLMLVLALNPDPARRHRLAHARIVIIGGIALPVAVLSGLLTYGFHYLGAGSARGDAAAPDITIIGKRWWWEVIYQDGGRRIVSANELRLPVGQPMVLNLESDNVIHSFWAPQLAGKLDMIPGRTNVLTVTAEKAGISRGQCAEFCGAAHALMSFQVVAMPPEDFREWLAAQSAPAAPPRTQEMRRGAIIFAQNGCGACHQVRGTAAAGTIGPDLTHVGSRLSLGAATLANDAAAFARWIAGSQHVKPDNLMPDFSHLTADELSDLAAYLDGLE